MTIELLREFFGYCAILNIGVLAFTGIFIVLLRKAITSIHSKMFDLDERDLSRAYFQFMSLYKMLVIAFVIVPYFALLLMS